MKKRKKALQSQKSKATILWLVLAFIGLGVLAFYQSAREINLCSEGVETSATVNNVTTSLSENHYYGRSLKIFNIELGYSAAGKPTSVSRAFNKGEVGKLFSADGISIGDTVLILVDEEKPKRLKLVSECEK